MMQLEKAILKPAPEEKLLDEDFAIEFMFNPTNLKFVRKVSWGGEKKPPKPAEDPDMLPKSNFSGVSPYSLTISGIIYDTYESGESVWKKYIEKLHKATFPPNPPKKKDENPKDKRPAIYIFNWGTLFFFRCVVTNLNFTYEMFLPNGTPVRAKVTLTLQEVDKVTDSYLGAKPDRKKDNRIERKKK